MYLSDHDIQLELASKSLAIDPWPLPDQWQPCSIDLRLGDDFIQYRGLESEDIVDVAKGVDPKLVDHFMGVDSFRLMPGEFALATTLERIWLPNHLLARVEGRSSLGRLGLSVHVTAGFIDPGFQGQVTLELYNHQKNPLLLRPKMKICQMVFATMRSSVDNPYAGKYQNQDGVQVSRIEQDFKKG